MLNALPATQGRLKEGEPLAPMTWFRVGGPAEFMLRPANVEDLCDFLSQLPLEMPVMVIGAASNLIVRDGGINGVVIKLARGFGAVEVEADGIIAGAAALDVTVSEYAAAAGLGGLEFLSGIPGTIGGAVVMNAGAYGGDMASVLDWVDIVTRDGELKRLSVQELGLSYRHSNLPSDAVVVAVRLRAQPGEPVLIATKMNEIKLKREATQPVRARTGGSTFANPEGQKAWRLVDEAGCRGLRLGEAQVSELHCNFLLNLGGATAADLEGLGEEVRRRVKQKSGVSLRWEIKRIGVPI
ncbi:MAG: UDP-N-acetylmuramate dehydrogenase [Rhodospirillales bacterium]|nr:UDP-N-acetylmuramate dehydrogenase [Rhodospirillales bacterium]MDE2319324.1 UDP-N-acetylmuramate dehydrogenase [Rhodospirillales bacterium]